jgi:beta-lactam-binding protein with PASTA domain
VIRRAQGGVGVRPWRWLPAVVVAVGFGTTLLAATARATTAAGTVVVPRVSGQGVLVAYARLHAAGLRVSIPQGVSFVWSRPLKVARSSPSGGRRVVRLSVVRLYLSCCGRAGGPRVPKGRLPSYRMQNFVGSTVRDASLWATKRKLVFRAYLGALKAGRAAGLFANYRVSRQRPKAGTRLAVGQRTKPAMGWRGGLRFTPLTVWGVQPPPCTPPPGSTAVASNPEAVITTRTFQDSRGRLLGWYGCLRAVGTQRRLAVAGDYGSGGYDEYVDQVVLAGRFVAVVHSYQDKYMVCHSDVAIFDLETGQPGDVFEAACPSYFLPGPRPMIDSLLLNRNGFAAWRELRSAPPDAASGVSCPSVRLCIATDQYGYVLTTTEPTSGPLGWSWANIDGPIDLRGVSCPNERLCVAVDQNGNVLWSKHPTGGASSWHVTSVDPGQSMTAVSCPSTSLCVAGDASGNVITSTDPTGGKAAWSLAHVLAGNSSASLRGVSCVPQSLCILTDEAGDLITSTHPTGGSGAWTLTRVPGITAHAVSCASTSLCVAGGSSGTVLTSTNPTGGASAWTATKIPATNDIQTISCPSPTLCIAGDNLGHKLTSTNPKGGTSAWTGDPFQSGALISISCPSTSLCVAGDTQGNVVEFTDPARGVGRLSPLFMPWHCESGIAGTDCEVAARLYAFDDHRARLVDSAPAGNSLTNISLTGDVLTWMNNGIPRQATVG